MDLTNELTIADSDVALEILSRRKAQIAKLYYESKNEKYKKDLDYLKKLENELYSGNEQVINIINTEMLGDYQVVGDEYV